LLPIPGTFKRTIADLVLLTLDCSDSCRCTAEDMTVIFPESYFGALQCSGLLLVEQSANPVLTVLGFTINKEFIAQEYAVC